MKILIMLLCAVSVGVLTGCCTDDVACGSNVSYVATNTCASCNTCKTCQNTCSTCGSYGSYMNGGWY